MSTTSPRPHDIAVIGIACRFPGGVRTPDQLWELSYRGLDAVTEIPRARWPAGAHYSPGSAGPGGITTRWAGCIDDIDLFDADFFGISPHEAVQIDPQQRLLLETAHEALEAAGVPAHSRDLARGGVFVGISGSDYGRLLGRDLSAVDAHFSMGTASSIAANRLSYTFGMTGPSLAVDTACSSSLVAVHLAVRSLRAGECPIALAAGVNLVLAPEVWVSVSKAGMMSPTGRCRAFGEGADGFVRGDGCGVLVLKTLAQAETDGDPILGVIRGTAVNQDGASNGLTAPNGPAQEAVIKTALADAGVRPDQVGYVEAHGTGTPLGDPIEIGALAATYGRPAPGATVCRVGSVKSNIGHAEAAAGIAGLIRMLLSLREGYIPPTLHTETLNPRLPLHDTRLEIARQGTPWPSGLPRVGAVSSFGFGGTNGHVIVSEAENVGQTTGHSPDTTGPLVLTISGKNDQAVRDLVARYRSTLDDLADDDLRDLCYSASARRTHHGTRLAFTATNRTELRARLDSFDLASTDGGTGEKPWRDTVFVFSGQGQNLRETDSANGALLAERVFAEHARYCSRAFEPALGVSVLDLLTPSEQDFALLDRTDVAQAVLFTVQSGLFRLWSSFGVRPAAVAGHSAGEAAAAYAAGMLDLDPAINLVIARGTAMQAECGAGSMVAVSAPAEAVEPLLRKYRGSVVIAVENGPRNIVLSGPELPMRELVQELQSHEYRIRRLPGGFAFHSPAAAGASSALARTRAGRATGRGDVPFFSSVTGTLLDSGQLDTAHWARGVVSPVLFRQVVGEAVRWGFTNFLEIGPQPTLRGAVRASAHDAGAQATVLHGSHAEGRGSQGPRGILPDLYRRGAEIDWQSVYPGGRFLPGTPQYPWQHRSYWLSSTKQPIEGPVQDEQAVRRNTVLTNQTWAVDDVANELATVLKLPRAEIAEDSRFLELGADSILLQRLVTALNERHGSAFKATDLFEKYPSVGQLAAALAAEATVPAGRGTEPDLPPLGEPQAPSEAVPEDLLGQILKNQLEIMRHQLTLLEQPRAVHAQGHKREAAAASEGTAGAATRPAPAAPPRSPAPTPTNQGLSPAQQTYVDGLVRTLEQRSPSSKRLAARYRGKLVESRTWANFRPELKELNFPIVVRRSRGARFWDADGTEYTDYCLGFGVHFLGHNPRYVEDAVAEQVRLSFALGPQQELTYRVADQFCRITGHDRVSFTNTGSEAVMGATRLARLATGRPKVVYFEKSYHGITDVMLGRGAGTPGQVDAIAPGLSAAALGDALILPYDNPDSLDYIAAHADEIAAVLVEPVQARNPVTQPVPFLQRLRRLTDTTGIVLIFDEMITGFRVGIRGAQGLFGIKPDLATYGKVLGGGLGIAAIAGKESLMDGLDGGDWSYGDDSAPYAQTTLFGGTFQKHPLSIAAAGAVLTHLEQHGDRIYPEVNDRATRLTTALSRLFTDRGLPYSVATFGSLWRFQYRGLSNLYQPMSLEMLYHSLLAEGLYVWEGRTFFLSTEHTDSDAERFLEAVDRNLDSLAEADFLPAVRFDRKPDTGPLRWPMSPQQTELWRLCRRLGPDSLAYNEVVLIEFADKVDAVALSQAMAAVRQRHPALRAVCSSDGTEMVCSATKTEEIDCIDITEASSVDEHLHRLGNVPFDLSAGPLFRSALLRRTDDVSVLVISAHHLVFDGVSIATVIADLADAYQTTVSGTSPERDLMTPHSGPRASAGLDTDYWGPRLRDFPSPVWKRQPGETDQSGKAHRQTFRLDSGVWQELLVRCRALRTTAFLAAFSAFTAALHKVSGREDIVVTVPVDRRPGGAGQDWIGHFVTYVPIRSSRPEPEFHRERVTRQAIEDMSHAEAPLLSVLESLAQAGDVADPWAARQDLTSVVFDVNPAIPEVRLGDAKGEIVVPPPAEAKFDVFFDVIPIEGTVLVQVVHRDHVPAGDIERLWLRWSELIHRTAGIVPTPADDPFPSK